MTQPVCRFMLGAAVLLFACIHAAAENPIGKLFSTPDERAAADRQRARSQPGSDDAMPPQETSRLTTVDGVVRRSSGRSTVWVNQVPLHESQRAAGPVLQQGSQPGVRFGLGSGGNVTLRPGQSYDSGRRRVLDAYQLPQADPGEQAK